MCAGPGHINSANKQEKTEEKEGKKRNRRRKDKEKEEKSRKKTPLYLTTHLPSITKKEEEKREKKRRGGEGDLKRARRPWQILTEKGVCSLLPQRKWRGTLFIGNAGPRSDPSSAPRHPPHISTR